MLKQQIYKIVIIGMIGIIGIIGITGEGLHMKLKQWLKEYHEMSYSGYKALPEEKKWWLEADFVEYNRSLQIKNSGKDRQERRDSKDNTFISRRPMTKEEISELDKVLEKERKRYDYSLKCGGIDENGNYTALSHRWNN